MTEEEIRKAARRAWRELRAIVRDGRDVCDELVVGHAMRALAATETLLDEIDGRARIARVAVPHGHDEDLRRRIGDVFRYGHGIDPVVVAGRQILVEPAAHRTAALEADLAAEVDAYEAERFVVATLEVGTDGRVIRADVSDDGARWASYAGATVGALVDALGAEYGDRLDCGIRIVGGDDE